MFYSTVQSQYGTKGKRVLKEGREPRRREGWREGGRWIFGLSNHIGYEGVGEDEWRYFGETGSLSERSDHPPARTIPTTGKRLVLLTLTDKPSSKTY